MFIQDDILDHYKYPRNEGKLKNPDVEIVETNASCGDTIKLQLQFDRKKRPRLGLQRRIANIKYLCEGCSIAKASTSMLSELVIGKTAKEILSLTQKDIEKLLGSPVSLGRLKCATLGLSALKNAINKYNKEIKTTKKSMPKKASKTSKPLSARRDEPKLTKDINLGELMAHYPKAAEKLVEDYGLHCVGCFAAAFETLEQGLKVHGYSDKKIDKILKSLQSLDK